MFSIRLDPLKAPKRPKKVPSEQIAEKQQPEPPLLDYHYITDPITAKEAVSILLEHKGVIGFDIETEKLPQYINHPEAGLNPHLSKIRLMQFYAEGLPTYIFDLRCVDIELIKPVFMQAELVAHNAIFELGHLYHAGLLIADIHCTLLTSKILPGNGKSPSLKNMCHKHLNIDLSKALQTSNWSQEHLSPEQLQYAALDAVLALKLHNVLWEQLKKNSQNLNYELFRQTMYPTMKMMYHGCRFDLAKHQVMKFVWERELKGLKSEFWELTKGEIDNISSNKQVSDWLIKNLPESILKDWERSEKTGHLSLDKDTIAQFVGCHPVINSYSQMQKLQKMVSTYGDSLAKKVNPRTGRIHPNYQIGGAATGRFTCSKPNLQQAPRLDEFRALFNVEDGKNLAAADYSQVELRVMAEMSGDQVMRKVYRQNGDLHLSTAASMTGKDANEVSKDERSAAKAVNFGLIYGMGAKGLVEYAKNTYGVKMSLREAKRYRKAFFETYPEIGPWQHKLFTGSDRSKITKTPLGRRIDIRQQPEKVYTRSRNYPVQGGAAEVMMHAMIILDNMIVESDLDIKLVNVVHDEIIIEVLAEHAEEAAKILEEAMVKGMLAVFSHATIEGLVDVKIGLSWAETK